MTDDEAKSMLDALAKHYGEPVMPVSRYCNALHTWASKVPGRHGYDRLYGSEYQKWVNRIRLDIAKSSLLYRIIYLGEPLRTKQCPVHQGRWHGEAMLKGCEHECDGTGWLRESM